MCEILLLIISDAVTPHNTIYDLVKHTIDMDTSSTSHCCQRLLHALDTLP